MKRVYGSRPLFLSRVESGAAFAAKAILFLSAVLWVFGTETVFADSHSEGETLFVERGCVRCHTVGRGRFAGPDLKGVFGKYSREGVVLWITDPSAVYKAGGKVPVNEGYPPMPQTRVGTGEAEKIADYLLSLQDIPDESQEGGAIGGKVVNRTRGEPAGGIEVALGSFLGDRQISSRSEETGSEGEFRFEGVEWTAAHKISIVSGGVFYETDKMVFKPGQREIDISLPIYETGSDDGAIAVELSHIIVEPSEGGVSVVEFVEFANRGDTVVVSGGEGGESATLRFGVPKEAEDLRFIHGLDASGIFKQDGGFSSRPVLPGLKRAVLSYRIPFESGVFGGGRAVFAKTLEYRTESFAVIAPASGGVTVEGLGEGKSVSGEDGRVFSRWDGAAFEKGYEVRISVRSSGGERPAWVLSVAVFACVLLVAGAYAVFGRLRS